MRECVLMEKRTHTQNIYAIHSLLTALLWYLIYLSYMKYCIINIFFLFVRIFVQCHLSFSFIGIWHFRWDFSVLSVEFVWTSYSSFWFRLRFRNDRRYKMNVFYFHNSFIICLLRCERLRVIFFPCDNTQMDNPVIMN